MMQIDNTASMIEIDEFVHLLENDKFGLHELQSFIHDSTFIENDNFLNDYSILQNNRTGNLIDGIEIEQSPCKNMNLDNIETAKMEAFKILISD